MNYTKPLPEAEELKELSESVSDFPISTNRLLQIAEASPHSNELVNFLRLFHGEFESRADLYARATELIFLIKEENRQPEEQVLSPQD